MDQEPTKRSRSRKRDAEGASEASAASDASADPASQVPNVRPSRDKVLSVQEDALTVPAHDPRAAIADGLAALLTPVQVTFMLEQVLAITKRVALTGRCKNCGHEIRDYTEVPDAKAVVSALTDLINHGFGRPDVAKMERDMVEFRRFTDFTEWEERDAES